MLERTNQSIHRLLAFLLSATENIILGLEGKLNILISG